MSSSKTLHRVRVKGTGSYLPEKLLSNKDLEQMVVTNDAKIVELTGIRNRAIAAPGQVTSDLALIAAQRALEAANMTAQDIDGIIFATVSPDQIMPNTACILQKKLGCRGDVMAIDISAACSGFVYGFGMGSDFIAMGRYKNLLVI
ncbi:MAG: 3-oxoacyl-ACP synthase, partial [Bdellovibrionota bacterium]